MTRTQQAILLSILVIFGVVFYFVQQQPRDVTEKTDYAAQYNDQFAIPTLMTDLKNDEKIKQVTDTPAPDVQGESTVEKPTTATKAIIKTSKGDITLELYPDAAPKTVANFVKKANSGFYKNLTFHRVEDWVVQGGDPSGNGTGGGSMPTEFNDKPYVVGSLGVARRNDPTVQNDAQFFITKQEASWLDKQYTNFGLVTEGMDVVNEMAIGDKILEITVE